MSAKPKLTAEEIAALVKAAESLFGFDELIFALAGAIGPIRATRLATTRKAIPWTKKDTEAVAMALYPLIPGKTAKSKRMTITAALRPCFGTKARYEEVMLYAIERIEAWLSGIEAGADKPASNARPKLGAGTISGYGPVNLWWKMSEAVLSKILARMQAKNVRYFPVEAVGNGDEDALGSETKMATIRSRWAFVAQECRKRGIWFAPILFNDNVGKGNWKNGKIPLSARLQQAQAFVDWVAKQDPDGVLVTIVAETRTSAGKAMEAYANPKLKAAGYQTVNNSGSRPQATTSFGGIKTDFFCYHPVSTGDWPKDKAAHVLSDTGAILAQLNLKNDPYARGNPAALKAWFADGKARGFAVVAYYAFQTDGYDEAAIDAMANGSAQDKPVAPDGPTADGDDVDVSKAVWVGRTNGANAAVTDDIAPLTQSKTHFFYKQTPGTKNWKPRFTDNGKDLNSAACICVWRNGNWLCARFDDCSETRNSREKKNILNGYVKGIRPVVGEPFRFLLVNADGKYRTKAPGGLWTQ